MPLVSRLKRYPRTIYRRLCFWPLRLLYDYSARFRSYYWEFRAPDVHAQWGHTTTNFDNIASVIRDLAPRRILDYGCGSGRLLPLYTNLAVPEVVGYDISPKAIEMCRVRTVGSGISFLSGDMSALPFPTGYFDLVICNRVLQHIPPKQIRRVLSELVYYAKSIYLCEMSRNDAKSQFFFMFLHDYKSILSSLGFYIAAESESGAVNHWRVFSRYPVNA